MKIFRLLSILLTAVMTSGCGGNGESQIQAEGLEEHQLLKLDSIGVEMGDSNYVFGMPRALEFTSRGNIVVGDIVRMKMMMYSPQGLFLRSGGTQGEGPGEFAAPTGISATPEGGILVADAMGGKLIIYDSLLNCSNELRGFDPYPPESPILLDDGSLVGTRQIFDQSVGSVTNSLARWDPGEVEPSIVYMERTAQFNSQNPMEAFRNTGILFCVSSEGNVICAPLTTDEYVVTCLGIDGDRIWEASPGYERTRRTEEAIEIEKEMVRAAVTRNGGDPSMVDRMDFEEWAYAVSGLYARDGMIWVRRGSDLVPRFDIYTNGGECVGRCTVPQLPYGSSVGFAFSPDSRNVLAYVANPQDYSRIWILRDPEEPVPETLSLASPGLTTCTLSVHDDLQPMEINLYWTGPPDVPDGFRLCHTLSASPLHSDTAVVFDGLDARYYSDAEIGHYLICQDMNFDGYNDLRLMQSPSAGPNTYWYFWLLDPETGMLTEADGYGTDLLVSPEFDQENRVIRCFHRDGMGMYGSEVYRVDDDLPVLIRSEESRYDDLDSYVTIVRELVDGEMIVTDTLVETVD